MEELFKVCKKYKEGKCTLEELYRRLSWIGVPDRYIELVAETERKLEMIQFTRLESKWYEEAVEVIDSLLSQIE